MLTIRSGDYCVAVDSYRKVFIQLDLSISVGVDFSEDIVQYFSRYVLTLPLRKHKSVRQFTSTSIVDFPVCHAQINGLTYLPAFLFSSQ